MVDSGDIFNSFFVSGGYLPLDERSRHLASIVFPVALAEVRRKWEDFQHGDPAPAPGAPEGPSVFDVKVEATKENLTKILDLFDKIHNARDAFVSSSPGFTGIRRKNIDNLKKLGYSLHRNRLNCNVSRLVGSSVGVVGAIALLSCLFPPAAVVIVPLSITGGGAALAGGGVVFGTTVTEYGLIRTKMTKAQEILKNDQKSFQPMAEYFEHTIAFVAAVDAVLDFKVMTTLATDLKEFAADVRRWNNCFIAQLKSTFADILDLLPIPMASLGIHLTAIALTFCVVAVLAHQKNCIILDGIILTHRLVFGFLSGLDLGVEVGRAVMMLIRGGKLTADISGQLARAVFHGVFGGVGLALDVINIVLTSYDVHKGSLSKQGTLILNAANKLSEELEFIEEVYKNLLKGGATVRYSKR